MPSIENLHSSGDLRRALGYIMESGAYASQAVTQFAIQFTGVELVAAFFDSKPLGSQINSARTLLKRHEALGDRSTVTADPAMRAIALEDLASLSWLLKYRNDAAHETWGVRAPETTTPVVVGSRTGTHVGRIETTIPTLIQVGTLIWDAAAALSAAGWAIESLRERSRDDLQVMAMDSPENHPDDVRSAEERRASLSARIKDAQAGRLPNWEWREIEFQRYPSVEDTTAE